MAALTGKRDYDAVKKALEAAGYQGEKVVLMGATDQPTNYPLAEVAADMLKRVGVNVDYQATDWGMVVQRRALTKPPADGGWNMFCTGFSGLDFFTPASHLPLRGNGKGAWFGWPDDPKIEALREAWFNAPDLAAQKKVGAEMQLQAFENVPYYPLGVAQLPTAFRPTSPACRRASRSSGTSAAPDGRTAPGHERGHRHLRRGGAPGRRGPAPRCAGASRPPPHSVARFADPLFVPTGARWPFRTVRGFGDGGICWFRAACRGPHPAGGDRHRYAVLGPRGGSTDAAGTRSPHRCSRPAAVPSAALSDVAAPDGHPGACRGSARRPGRDTLVAALLLVAARGAGTSVRRDGGTVPALAREVRPTLTLRDALPSRGRGASNQTGPAPGTWLGCRTAPRWGRAAPSHVPGVSARSTDTPSVAIVPAGV